MEIITIMLLLLTGLMMFGIFFYFSDKGEKIL